MRLRNKILLSAAALVFVGGGVFYYLNSRDHYDPSKYSATITAPKKTSEPAAPANADTPDVETPIAKTGLVIGMKVELTLPDQFDTPHTIGPKVETLLFAFSKGPGGTIRGYLDKQGADFLAVHKALFIADISPIPVVIRNTLALPKLRKSAYPVMLIYEDEMAAALRNPDHEEEIAIVTIKEHVVQSIRYCKNETELAEVFE